jgi:hypothetical protein
LQKGREGEEASFGLLLSRRTRRQWRWRVAPRAATVPALLLRFQKCSSAIPAVLGDYFVKFELFDVIFIYFWIL